MAWRCWLRRGAPWLCAGLLGALTFGACAEETDDRFDDDDSSGGTGAATTGTGGTGATGNTGTGAGTTSGGTSTGTETGTTTPCHDTGVEPNDTEQQATYLGAPNDCDWNGGVVEGVLADDDVDWYWYEGSDQMGCSVNPTRAADATETVRVCAFYECPSLTFTCPDGTTADTSPEGRAGCCSTSGFTVSDIDCQGASDDALVYMRLDKPPAFPCVPYSLSYHY